MSVKMVVVPPKGAVCRGGVWYHAGESYPVIERKSKKGASDGKKTTSKS